MFSARAPILQSVAIVLFTAHCLCIVTGGAHAQEAKRPNIVLIMADDLGFEGLGAYGSASYESPRLDEMAAKGMLFSHAYSQPLCTPSRVQIMTGRYNHRNYTQFGVLPPDEITFGHMLQTAGYRTCVAGKWQLYGFDNKVFKSGGIGTHPDDAGFDAYCLWQATEPRSAGERYAEPLVQLSGKKAKVFDDQYGPDIYADFVLDFMEENRDEPFFVYYPMALVHNPFVPTPDVPEWDGDRYAGDNEHFADMISYMDKIVGRIVDKVAALGLADNTLILFIGDNGTNTKISSAMRDGRVIRGDKGQPTDYGTHVPMIAYWPGVTPEGTICDDLIDFSDFVPTIAKLAEAKLPDDRIIDGVSFVPQLLGEVGNPRSWVFCHYEPNWGNRPRTRFIRDKRWKLYDDGRFVDVMHDPLEKYLLNDENLEPQAREARSQLQRALDWFIAEEKER